MGMPISASRGYNTVLSNPTTQAQGTHHRHKAGAEVQAAQQATNPATSSSTSQTSAASSSTATSATGDLGSLLDTIA
jgi:hypothetical protein